MRLAATMTLALTVACCAPGFAVASGAKALTLATTTSVQDSGLLDVLLPPFEKQERVKVRVLAVGSGQALELGRRGDADVLVVHSPEQETAFVRAGHGLARRPFMYNEFLIAGPKADPAGLRGLKSAVSAFAAVARAKARFVSRGDESGTHVREKQIWAKAGLTPQGEWYIVGGSGMAATLRLASEKQAYTLTDLATFLTWKARLALEVMVQGGPFLQNIYSVIVIPPRAHPGVNSQLAQRFSDYLFCAKTAKLIAAFGKDRYGQPLFRVLRDQQSAKPSGKPK